MRLLSRTFLLTGFALAATTVAAFPAIADLPSASPNRPWVEHTFSAELAGHELPVDVYQPADRAPAAVAVVAHGFTRSRTRHRDLGESLAASGVAAVVPDLPYVVYHHGNGEAIVELVHRLEAGDLGLPPFARSRILLIGTSAGGFATVLAAAELPGIAGWIGLDPVDRTGFAVDAATRMTAPAVVLRGESSRCNLYGSARSIARALPLLQRHTFIEGASHCDFEGPTSKLCRVLCGGSSTEAQARIREETVDAALEMLARGGPAAAPPNQGEVR